MLWAGPNLYFAIVIAVLFLPPILSFGIAVGQKMAGEYKNGEKFKEDREKNRIKAAQKAKEKEEKDRAQMERIEKERIRLEKERMEKLKKERERKEKERKKKEQKEKEKNKKKEGKNPESTKPKSPKTRRRRRGQQQQEEAQQSPPKQDQQTAKAQELPTYLQDFPQWPKSLSHLLPPVNDIHDLDYWLEDPIRHSSLCSIMSTILHPLDPDPLPLPKQVRDVLNDLEEARLSHHVLEVELWADTHPEKLDGLRRHVRLTFACEGAEGLVETGKVNEVVPMTSLAAVTATAGVAVYATTGLIG